MGLWSWTKRAAGRVYDAGAKVVDVVSHPIESTKTAINAVESARQWTVDKVATGMAYAARGAEWLSKGENWKKMGDGIKLYGEFLREDPIGALKAAGRGGVNAVWAVGGLAADVTVFAAKMTVKASPLTMIYNLGASEENKLTLESWPKFGECTSGLTKWGNDHLVHTLGQDWAVPAAAYEYERYPPGHPQEGDVIFETDPNTGEKVPKFKTLGQDEYGNDIYVKDKYYMCKAVTSQIAQAVVEVPAFIAAAALTGGAAGVAMASAKGAAMIAQKTLSGYRAGQAIIGLTKAVAKVGTYGLSSPIARQVAKLPSNPLKAFGTTAKASGKWMSPLKKNQWLHAEYAHKATSAGKKGASLMKAYEGVADPSLLRRINYVFHKSALQGSLKQSADKAFSKAGKFGRWADDYKDMKGWHMPFKGSAHKLDDLKEWGPEAAGFALATSIGIVNDRREQQQKISLDESFDEGTKASYDRTLEQGIRDLVDFAVKDGTVNQIELQIIVDTVKSQQAQNLMFDPAFLQDVAEQLGVDPTIFDTQNQTPEDATKMNANPGFQQAAAPHPAQQAGDTSLSDAANFAFGQDYQFTQSLNTGFAFSPSLNPYRIGNQNIFTTSGVTAA